MNQLKPCAIMTRLREKTLLHANAALSTSSRIIIDQIIPSLEKGRFAAKCAQDTPFAVEAVILCDSLESIKADLLWRHENDLYFKRTPMTALGDDRYAAVIRPAQAGRYVYTVEASIDQFTGWKESFLRNLHAGKATPSECACGSILMQEYAEHPGHAAHEQHRALKLIEAFTTMCADLPLLSGLEVEKITDLLETPDLVNIMRSVWDDPGTVKFDGELPLAVDPPCAVFSAGYEFLPLSRKSTIRSILRDVLEQLPHIADMGFDIVHLPVKLEEKDRRDFSFLAETARNLNLTLALDISFEYDGPEENYPEDDESRQILRENFKRTLLSWTRSGIYAFRVINPHAKSFAFWEWCIRETRKECPNAIFIAGAVSRPYIMAYLAKIGFNQSYTYFGWLHDKTELTQYMEELTHSELQYYFRPVFWPNTPDILSDVIHGDNSLFVQRLVLAAMMSSNYGVYGPPLDRDTWEQSGLAPLISKINAIRRENPALQSNGSILFHDTDNENLIAWTKQSGSNLILSVVNLDMCNTQSGTISPHPDRIELGPDKAFMLVDILNDRRFEWRGQKSRITLDPRTMPACVFRIEPI